MPSQARCGGRWPVASPVGRRAVARPQAPRRSAPGDGERVFALGAGGGQIYTCTTGGLAPTSGCDATTIGVVARVPYTATYCFAEGK